MKTLVYLGLLLPLLAYAAEFEGENALPYRTVCAEQFRAIFHDTRGALVSVTTQRKEFRVAVHSADADAFFTDVRSIVGDYRRADRNEWRLKLRDTPDSPDEMFITDTDYVRNIIGVNEAGREVHRARIRKRKYAVVPRGMSVEEFSRLPGDQVVYAKLADGEGIYSKWEFKVGSPEVDEETGESHDLEGVVDKLGPVMLDSDIDLLQSSPEAFREHRDAVAKRTKEIWLTRKGHRGLVNTPEEVDRMIRRQGWLHEQGWKQKEMGPQIRMRYIRNAYRVEFPRPGRPGEKVEIQLTFDSDIVQTYLKSGNTDQSFPTERVIELKIPVEFAALTDAELEAIGLGEMARIRARYMLLKPLKGRPRNRGKRSNLAG